MKFFLYRFEVLGKCITCIVQIVRSSRGRATAMFSTRIYYKYTLSSCSARIGFDLRAVSSVVSIGRGVGRMRVCGSIRAEVCSRGWSGTWRRWPRGWRRAEPRRSSALSSI